MTKLDFFEQYKRLHSRWPDRFMTDNPTKLRSLFELWEPLAVSELKSLIDRMIGANKHDFDLVKAAVSLKKAKAEVEKTNALLEKEVEMSPDALSNVLSELGASSLFDAILKSKGQQNGN